MRASLVMDQDELRTDARDRRARFPDLPVTPPDEVIAALFRPALPALGAATR
jgi:hypothetical protein